MDIQVDLGSGTTVNFSSAGVYFETTQVLRPQQEISVVFPFLHAAPGSRAACSACVLRVDALPNGYGVAAAYETVALQVLEPH